MQPKRKHVQDVMMRKPLYSISTEPQKITLYLSSIH